jgi:NADPH:quinone reductase-like Zn-dependent oxidoreductase
LRPKSNSTLAAGQEIPMRAIAVDKLKGEPRLLELPKPQPKPDQLLVKIAATAINPFDWKVADGIMGDAVPYVLPLVLGQDAAGTVAGVGDKVTRFKVGERIFGQFFHFPLGEGTFAEFTVVPETGVIAPLPKAVSDEIGAALPTAGMTALALVEALGLRAGASVVIVGATGGVGAFATQLAAAKGLRVLATAGAADAERMRRLGAAETLDNRQGDLGIQVKQNHPAGVDGIIDLVSDAPAFAALAPLVRKGGAMFSTIGSADEKSLQSQGLRGGNFQLKASTSLLRSLASAAESGRLTVPIEATIALEDTPTAIARSRAGQSKGKTVIRLTA